MAKTSGISVEGLETTIANLNREIDRIPRVTLKGLIAAALFILGKAQDMCPVLTGNLKGSGFVIWGKVQGSNLTGNFVDSGKGDLSQLQTDHRATIDDDRKTLPVFRRGSYDAAVEIGFSAYYSYWVHENLEARHKGKGQAKFLEKAVNQFMSKIIDFASEKLP